MMTFAIRMVMAIVALALALASAARSASAAIAPSRESVFTDTSYVEAAVATEDTLWVGTRGGLEEYDLKSLALRRLYTTADGLAANRILSVASSPGGDLAVRVDRANCRKVGVVFACVSEAAAPAAIRPPRGSPAPPQFRGARVTTEVVVGRHRFVGTAGQGLWLAGTPARRLTPENQICGNHVMAIASFRDRTWFGTFDEGLCSFDGHTFRRARGRFRMINDLAVTSDALYVAATTGLFRTTDGERFEQVISLDGRGAIDLAVDGDGLWVVTSVSLWRLAVGVEPRAHQRPVRRYFRPGGARALQAVDARAGVVWLASEDAGALRLRNGRFEVFDRAAGMPSSWTVDVVATADGGAYVASLRYGLFRIEPNGRMGAPPHGDLDPWLLHVSVTPEDGQVWVGSQDGAARFGTDSTLRGLPGIPHPCVHVIWPSPAGLWVGTEGGTVLLPRPLVLGAKGKA